MKTMSTYVHQHLYSCPQYSNLRLYSCFIFILASISKFVLIFMFKVKLVCRFMFVSMILFANMYIYAI